MCSPSSDSSNVVVRDEQSPLSEPTRWSVFTPEGAWLGSIEMPPGFILHAVTADRALGFVVDGFGVKRIEAYELTRSP
jgi:hypothetical protein